MNRNVPAIMAIMLTIAITAIFIGNVLAEPARSFAEEKCVYLTFDDGPSDRVTPAVLDVLKEENVKATFFIIGSNAKRRKDILKRACGEGHTLAVHSYSHDYSQIYSSPEALLADIQKCNEVIEEITGEPSRVYRFPGGSFTVAPELKKAVTDGGFRYFDWNASFRDSELPDASPEELYKNAVSTVANPKRVVMLAHDSTNKSATACALKKVILYFKDRGYSFGTL